MRHFHRCHVGADAVLEAADRFFPTIGGARSSTLSRSRSYAGPLGTVTVTVRAEGGHYTLVDVETDQLGESRLDRNVKRFFVRIRAAAGPARALESAY